MWKPEPSWSPLGTPGRSGNGVWLAQASGRNWVVKRLNAPLPGDPSGLFEPTHGGYWRREVEVALDGPLLATSGLRGPEVLRVDEDDSGATIWQAAVDQTESTGLFRARALGRFAAQEIPPRPWFAREVLAERTEALALRGGWRTLARTTVADLADLLWLRRRGLLDRMNEIAAVPSHGDPTPANLRGRHGDDVLAVDWGTFGLAQAGADLGYLALSEREDFDVLLAAYLEGIGGLVPADQVAYAARLTVVFTALNRAEWTLAQVAAGEGALAGKFRHPAVRPALASLQRLLPQADALL